MTIADTTSLFVRYIDVCNTALMAHKDTFPYKQMLALSEKVLVGKIIGMAVYDDDPEIVTGDFTVRFSGNQLEPVVSPGGDRTFTVKLKRDYMIRVVKNRQEYIDHPEKLDWEWLKSRLGIGERAHRHIAIKSVMTHNLHFVGPQASLREAAQKMKDLDVGALPVSVEPDQEPIGMLTDRDITVRAVAAGLDPNTTMVHEVMTPGVASCSDTADITDALRIMEEKQIRRLLVLDTERRPVGILSLGDVAWRNGDEQLAARLLTRICTPSVSAA